MNTIHPLVSIIIPCYNQGHFLAEAIESALSQDYTNIEVTIIDDGSTDYTRDVAAQFDVSYIHQNNAGLSAARNKGIEYSGGKYLLFLDSDDRLVAGAITKSVECMEQNQNYGFVFGQFSCILESGQKMPWYRQPYASMDIPLSVRWLVDFKMLIFRLLTGAPLHRVGAEHYEAMLKWNYIGMHATVLYNRTTFNKVGGFDISLQACEDVDMYLRVTHKLPVAYHPNLVAEYRKHAQSMSRDMSRMITAITSVMERQKPLVKGDKKLENAYQCGERYWHRYFGTISKFTA